MRKAWKRVQEREDAQLRKQKSHAEEKKREIESGIQDEHGNKQVAV